MTVTKTSWTSTPKRSPCICQTPHRLKSPLPFFLQSPCHRYKDSQSNAVKKSFTIEHIRNNYPHDNWTHDYTGGSGEQGEQWSRNLSTSEGESKDLATDVFSTKLKSEAVVIQIWASPVLGSSDTYSNVFFTDALSVLHTLQTAKNENTWPLLSYSHPDNLTSAAKLSLAWSPQALYQKGGNHRGTKLDGRLEDLRPTAAFLGEVGVPI